MSADRAALFKQLEANQQTVTAARQAVDDAYTALRLCGWGKIEKVTWDSSWESDDQGGSYISINSTFLHMNGKSYPIGSTLDDIYPDDIEEDTPADLLITKYVLAGISNRFDAFKHALAELANLSFEEFEEFTHLAYSLVEEDKEAGEVNFVH